jgi:Ser/Thr protein kinase RdoA (MazF antagonist)
MSPRFASGSPSLSSETAVIEVVRQAVGAHASVRVHDWHVRRDNYVVASVETQQPALRLIVKLEVPGERPNRNFDSMAAIARLVRSQTAVPTFDVVAVDTSRQQWPWEYLVVTELAGSTWMQLYPGLESAARQEAQRQIGRAAGQLHALRFEAFGQIGPDGSVLDGTTALPALIRRAQRRLTNPRYLALMLEALDRHTYLFAGLATATLCHEDLNPFNLVFNVRDGLPELVGILDFESAWASTGESDLARLEFWWMTAGTAIREGYTEVASVADEYMLRRPLLQLLWCLEYAEQHASPEHQAFTNRVFAELGLPDFQLG